ncbi:MAG TPA: type 2 lanthipeptide synthetase LanM family protein [Thermoanaerobaculia bacterium]|nr:type 2 lanthipeptide synthetase LanM family protein [Thermoanaerobaculia bacterium]
MYDGTQLLEERKSTAELLSSPRWFLAETLAERLASRRRRGIVSAGEHPAAAKRLARWKSQSAFAKSPGLWEKRLASIDLTEGELLQLLGETAEDVRAYSDPPAWLEVIATAYGHGGRTSAFPWPARTDLDRCPFLAFAEPLVQHYCDKLEAVARAEGGPFTPGIARTLAGHLPDHLAPMLNRTLLVEMHALKLEERLAGETPEARFADFIEQLRDRTYALEILELYPVLARQLVQRLEHWYESSAELLQRLAADAELFRDQGRVADVYGALSDFHRGGRSVMIVVFESGFRIVYKPKSLAIEAAFQQLLGRVDFQPAFRQMQVVDRGDYGWMEYVQPEACADDAALQRFLERQGGYLALLYLLDGTDFHHENLIAVGEQPILIDLETLFQPALNIPDLHDPASAPGAPLRSTVLRANLLPERWWGSGAAAGVDLSGLTAMDGQVTPRALPSVADAGRDTMRIEHRQLTIPAGENRVRVEGREVRAAEFVAPLERGFRRMYAWLMDNRDAFSGELDAFAGAEMRLLFRNTMHYGTVWLESFHPYALGNALDRDRLFDGLWAVQPRRPFLAALSACEIEDLHGGDIPLFVTDPASADVLHWKGTRFAGFFGESGIARSRRKLQALSQSDCEAQVAVIRDAFDALRISGPGIRRPSYELTPSTRPASGELLALARRAGDRIVERAFTDEREAHWLTLDYRDPNGWQLVPAGPDFYLGLTGVAFFLAHLGAATNEARYTEVARKAIFAQRRQLEADPAVVTAAGAFNGWGGIVYTLAHLGRLWKDDALLDEAERYARRLAVEQDVMLDLIIGSAGAICSLAALAEVRPSAWLEERMRACGERLLATAVPQPRGLGWPMPIAGNRALAGLSHGAAGIALALLRLYGRTGDARFRDAALQGIEYERSLFDAAEENWPDLRVDPNGVDAGEEGEHFMLAWCHGAPGIGLARIAGLPWLDDAEVRREIDVAVRSTLAGGFGENHSLCHGDLGNLELIFAAARVRGDAALEKRAWSIAGGIADSIRERGWVFGLPGNIETPGLMAGLAGVGYGLGRLARPDAFPDLLTLES